MSLTFHQAIMFLKPKEFFVYSICYIFGFFFLCWEMGNLFLGPYSHKISMIHILLRQEYMPFHRDLSDYLVAIIYITALFCYCIARKLEMNVMPQIITDKKTFKSTTGYDIIF